MDFLSSPEFWLALGQIILINIVLSGDNAVVIALACRSLPPQQQKKAIMFGSGGRRDINPRRASAASIWRSKISGAGDPIPRTSS